MLPSMHPPATDRTISLSDSLAGHVAKQLALRRSACWRGGASLLRWWRVLWRRRLRSHGTRIHWGQKTVRAHRHKTARGLQPP